MNPVPVIDLFAGPGGLGEGFSSLFEGDMPYFKTVLSIEKEPNAHSTLELRSFFRQFGPKEAPEDYYRFLRQEISREELFHNYPEQAAKARSEAKLATLGGIAATQVDGQRLFGMKFDDIENPGKTTESELNTFCIAHHGA